ncbi:MAG: hypothetical protein CTY19_04375 [Methylomonas sp.]|nr:MAG: hypothetical protein CTY19_04375 [Methylomonas sp.]
MGFFAFSPQSQAVLVSFDSGPLLFTYDTDNLMNMGSLEIIGTQLIFRPSLGLDAPADQISYYDSQPYAAIIDVRANAGFHLHGYSMTASGSSYVGDDATVGIHGSFNTTFYGASYYSGALTGSGPWSTTGSSSTPLPTLSISGEISTETTNHYSYQNFAGYTEYPYDMITSMF